MVIAYLLSLLYQEVPLKKKISVTRETPVKVAAVQKNNTTK